MDFLKYLLSNKWLNGNKYYQKLMLNNARRYALKHSLRVMGVSIETTLNCNARCIMCGHNTKEMHGTMTKELFEKIIDDCHASKIFTVGLSVYGEPFLDKYFFDRVKYLRKYNMSYGIFTNGSLLDPHKAQMLFDLGGLVNINFSVCGYEKKSYEDVMIGLRRDDTYKNILNFLRLKNSLKQEKLIVRISTVKTHVNRKEMRRFCRFWLHQKGVNYVITADLWDRVGEKNIDAIGPRSLFYKTTNWLVPCKSLWGSIYVYFDGRVSPCCENSDKRELIIGDMNNQTLKEIFSSNILHNLRTLHLGDERGAHKICGNCYHNLPWL